MATEFKLPEVAEGVESVDVVEVLVSPGDTVEQGTIILEAETGKSVAEIECGLAGTVAEVLVSPGDSIGIGATLITVNESGSSTPAVPPAEPAAEPEPAAAVEEAAAPEPAPAPAGSETIDFTLPEVAEGVEQIDVVEVHVSVGDSVSVGTVICEAETGKSVAEIESQHDGTITAVHIAAGDSVSIGSKLVTIDAQVSGSAPAAPAAAAPSQATPSPAPAAKPAATSKPAAPIASATSADGRAPAPAGPATRRLARKLGVDLYQVSGSARGGRITIEDVEAYVHGRMTSAAPSGGGMSLGIAAPQPLPDFSKFGPVEEEKLNKVYQAAAANLSTAWITIPHVTQHNLADITELEAARKRYVKDNSDKPKITMTAIMIKAVVGALRTFPRMNSSIDVESGHLILKKYYNIGVAVDTPNGLVVPVIRNCDQKNVLQVAAELTELAIKARDRKLKPEDMQGASFTITNLGGIGGTYFTPIVNPPEVAILGMSRGQKELHLEDGKVVERLMLPLSMSYDHRAINGADAARFIVKLSGSLTNFFELF